jgi:hypothetical protein
MSTTAISMGRSVWSERAGPQFAANVPLLRHAGWQSLGVGPRTNRVKERPAESMDRMSSARERTTSDWQFDSSGPKHRPAATKLRFCKVRHLLDPQPSNGCPAAIKLRFCKVRGSG